MLFVSFEFASDKVEQNDTYNLFFEANVDTSRPVATSDFRMNFFTLQYIYRAVVDIGHFI